MDNSKRFAVIIATYKRKNGSYHFLERVNSFLRKQTYQNFKMQQFLAFNAFKYFFV